MNLVARARLLVATLWAGSLWTVGYLVAPTLFASLPDRVLAGTIAGQLFRIEAWLSLGCAVMLLVLVRTVSGPENGRTRRQLLWLIAGMLGCVLVGYFGLQPFMSALRDAAGSSGVMNSESKMQFGILHGISSTFYLVQSVLALVLVIKIR